MASSSKRPSIDTGHDAKATSKKPRIITPSSGVPLEKSTPTVASKYKWQKGMIVRVYSREDGGWMDGEVTAVLEHRHLEGKDYPYCIRVEVEDEFGNKKIPKNFLDLSQTPLPSKEINSMTYFNDCKDDKYDIQLSCFPPIFNKGMTPSTKNFSKEYNN